MGKKMSLGSWQWPSCTHSKTLSFRANDHNIFKTINSVFFDPCEVETTPESWFTNSSESASFSTESEEFLGTTEEPLLEMIIKGVRSERLFFEPKYTSSILKEKAPCTEIQEQEKQDNEDLELHEEELPFKESVALALESEDPYLDFKKSMQEMVETHGIKDWENLQELLGWYLKMNGEINHGFIVAAFVDLLIQFSIIPPPTITTTTTTSTTTCISDSITTCYSSAASSFSSSPSSLVSLVGHKEIEEQENRSSSCSSLG